MTVFEKAMATNDACVSLHYSQEVKPQTTMSKDTAATILQDAIRTMKTSVDENVPAPQSKGASFAPTHNLMEVNILSLLGCSTQKNRDADLRPLLRDQVAVSNQT